MAIDGPAGGRPCMSAPAVLPVRSKFTIRSSACACRIEGAWKYSPAAAVPVRTKIPDPMMAPMPSAVSDQGPSVLLSLVSGCSESEISLSMDLQQNAWLLEVRMTAAAGSVDDCDKSRGLLTAGVGHGRSAHARHCSRRRRTAYRFAWPRASFFTLRFFDPRA